MSTQKYTNTNIILLEKHLKMDEWEAALRKCVVLFDTHSPSNENDFYKLLPLAGRSYLNKDL
jgi:hypothetical protein